MATVDASDFFNATARVKKRMNSKGFKGRVLLAGGIPIINKQREKVRRKTSATHNSIKSHLELNQEPAHNDIGPETDYSVHLEYGTKRMDPFPFVRPSEKDGAPGAIKAMGLVASEEVSEEWQK